jgi:hypothetical protein
MAWGHERLHVVRTQRQTDQLSQVKRAVDGGGVRNSHYGGDAAKNQQLRRKGRSMLLRSLLSAFALEIAMFLAAAATLPSRSVRRRPKKDPTPLRTGGG